MIHYTFKQLCRIISACQTILDFDDVKLYVFENQKHYIDTCGSHIFHNINLMCELQRRKVTRDHQKS